MKSRKAGLASIAFFYFDIKDEAKKNARGALCSLLIQLAAQSDLYSLLYTPKTILAPSSLLTMSPKNAYKIC